jgi:hypothetical protein
MVSYIAIDVAHILSQHCLGTSEFFRKRVLEQAELIQQVLSLFKYTKVFLGPPP